METDQLTRIHFCAFSSLSSQNLALSFGIFLLSRKGLIVCVNLFYFVCVHIIYFEGLMEDY